MLIIEKDSPNSDKPDYNLYESSLSKASASYFLDTKPKENMTEPGAHQTKAEGVTFSFGTTSWKYDKTIWDKD